MSGVLSVNGVDVGALNMEITSLGPAWSTPKVARSYIRIPGRFGAVPQGLAEGMEKRIPIQIHLASAEVSARQASRDAVVRHLSGLMKLEWSDAPGRVQWALIDDMDQASLFETIQYVRGNLRITTELVIPDAVSWSSQPTVLGLPADTPVEAQMGTAPSSPRVIIPGPWTDLQVSVLGPQLEEITSLQLVGSIGGDEVVEIDSSLASIVVEDTSTGERVRRLDLYDSGLFPLLDPHLMPQLQSSAAGVALYTRAWA